MIVWNNSLTVTNNRIATIIRQFSHITKSRIFKDLDLRKKVDCNFRGDFWKSHFKHLTLYSNPPGWMGRSCCHMGTLWMTKDWILRFWDSQPFKFWYVKVHRQRRLIPPKQVFVLNLRLLATQKFCSVKDRGFWFRN